MLLLFFFHKTIWAKQSRNKHLLDFKVPSLLAEILNKRLKLIRGNTVYNYYECTKCTVAKHIVAKHMVAFNIHIDDKITNYGTYEIQGNNYLVMILGFTK